MFPGLARRRCKTRVIFLCAGVWFNFFTYFRTAVLDPVRDGLSEFLRNRSELRYTTNAESAESDGSGFHVVVATFPAPQRNASDRFAATQGLESVSRFDAQLRTWMKESRPLADGGGFRLSLFDRFALTLNATSIDGLHYGSVVNVASAQLLLNYLENIEMEV